MKGKQQTENRQAAAYRKMKICKRQLAAGNRQHWQLATFSLPLPLLSRDEASSTIIMQQQKSTRGVARSQVAAK